jgi:hypothetical protein
MPAPTGARPKVFRTSGEIIIVFNENWNKVVHLFGIAVVESHENPRY